MGLIGPVFRAGLGGRLGSGRQWISCIAVEDLASMIGESLHNDVISGAMNAVMPDPVTNAEFTSTVAHALHRPALLPTPAWGLRLTLGDLSSLLLDSQRIVPSRFMALGYSYRSPTLKEALSDVF